MSSTPPYGAMPDQKRVSFTNTDAFKKVDIKPPANKLGQFNAIKSPYGPVTGKPPLNPYLYGKDNAESFMYPNKATVL
jgi:hypothetical protein